MNNVKNFLSVIFRDISSQDILSQNSYHNFQQHQNAKVRYDQLHTDIILKLMERRFISYSRNELRNFLKFINDECTDRRRYYGEMHYNGQCELKMDVFSVLFYYTENVLVIQDNEICCQYNNFLQWRMLTLDVSEEMLVTAFLADWDCRRRISRSDFGWSVVIGHNNNELNMIMKQGLAENHFHLKGSAPVFHLAWIHLMNDFSGKDREKVLSLDHTKRGVSQRVSDSQEEQPIYVKIVQAAAIRMYLFSLLTGIDVVISDKYYAADNISESHTCKKNGKQKKVDRLKQFVDDVLTHPEKAPIYESRVYHAINTLRQLYLKKGVTLAADYALYDERILKKSRQYYSSQGGEFILLWGERCFLYRMFQAIREGSLLNDWSKNIFYAYLVIKENIRAEFLQINDYVGFENFSIFEQRKGLFSSEDKLVKQAMHDALFSSHICFLEARISPWDTVEDNVKLVKRMDSLIDPEKRYQERFCYIMHFIKKQDEIQYDIGRTAVLVCRHAKLRDEIEQQASALIGMREKCPAIAKRILGIDACNQEIGCRPEVFGSVFRWLINHTAYEYAKEGLKPIPQLRITYHAGEDFLDLADGLRAIDEAISFLGMRCGDRLGHALALGVDVEEWYRTKNKIVIPMQDYLDNIVWVYYAMSLYNIPDVDNLKVHLEEQFEFYFEKIYRAHIRADMLKGIQKAAAEYYREIGQKHYYDGATLKFDINNYRKSCLLRGDDPIYYRNGFFRNIASESYMIKEYKVNWEFPQDFDIRYIPEAAILNYYYQYDRDVRRAGAICIEKKIHPAYIRAVKLIQKQMQKNVAIRGIAIEANPTSNFLIGTFKRYDKHPIVSWYNKSLEVDEKKLQESPQLSVSINTDDQGVFSTRLDNEYALMALALERFRDEKGRSVYNKTVIYQWIDDIRKFGLRQNFMSKYSSRFTERLKEVEDKCDEKQYYKKYQKPNKSIK